MAHRVTTGWSVVTTFGGRLAKKYERGLDALPQENPLRVLRGSQGHGDLRILQQLAEFLGREPHVPLAT